MSSNEGRAVARSAPYADWLRRERRRRAIVLASPAGLLLVFLLLRELLSGDRCATTAHALSLAILEGALAQRRARAIRLKHIFVDMMPAAYPSVVTS